MARPSGFQERLQQMEETKNERLSLLQVEKELQKKRLLQLAAKISNVRRLEQQCLILEQKCAAHDFRILTKKSEMESIEVDYQTTALKYRALKIEMDELEKQEKQWKRFYEEKSLDMEEFDEEVKRGLAASCEEVMKMSSSVTELKSSLKQLQASDGCINNPGILAAEKKKAELLALKDNTDRTVAAKQQLIVVLKKQLESFLTLNQKGLRGRTEKSNGLGY